MNVKSEIPRPTSLFLTSLPFRRASSHASLSGNPSARSEVVLGCVQPKFGGLALATEAEGYCRPRFSLRAANSHMSNIHEMPK